MMTALRSTVWVRLALAALLGSLVSHRALAQLQVIEPGWKHLRSGTEREWAEFPQTPDGQRLELTFSARKNATEHTLVVRQKDVKQGWQVALNGHKLGELARDENSMVVSFAIAAGQLVDGQNSLSIGAPAASKAAADDIRVGRIEIVDRPVEQWLSEATVEVEVVDAESGRPLPCRITVLDADGALQSLGNQSGSSLAVRPGTAFSSTGQAALGLPAGRYQIFAGRGFEYSLDSAEIDVGAGERVTKKLSIRREVPTEGYVACDTHIHTLTHSGHGDATIQERMITLAGEGIELPIATDHNQHIDFEPIAREMGVRGYFTPVMGNEVTTPRGHFNIFPVQTGARIVNFKQSDWGLLMDDIRQTPGVKAIILNHARDLHSGVRPFDPEHFNALVGENLDGWPMRFNAMEVINSGATQTEPLRLLRDWMGLLSRGLEVTPVGSSDSHDVARHFVGQGRTYIRCDDRDPARIDVAAAVDNFVAGRVMVSYGLLAELTVEQRFHSGDLATGLDAQEIQVQVRVLGPHWSRADHVQLLANGVVIKEERIPERPADAAQALGVQWVGNWTIPRPAHDVHLVAIATGPTIDAPYWRTAKPYQPRSPQWQGCTLGCSGAVWLDGDNDGQRWPARRYAERAVDASGRDWSKLMTHLAEYDETVAAHAAYLLERGGTPLSSAELVEALKQASAATQSGFQAYREAERASEIARAGRS